MPIEARQKPGSPGICGAFCFGFSTKPVMRPSLATCRMPKLEASAIGIFTAPMVSAAPFSTCSRSMSR